jgi:hypothetical protein
VKKIFIIISGQILHGSFITSAFRRQARIMKIDNPPSPPFRKGGMGGFEGYFLCNKR